MEAARSMSAAAVCERLERPLVPWVFELLVVVVVVVGIATEGRVVQALAFEVCDPVPKGSGLVVVAYVGHDDC